MTDPKENPQPLTQVREGVYESKTEPRVVDSARIKEIFNRLADPKGNPNAQIQDNRETCPNPPESQSRSGQAEHRSVRAEKINLYYTVSYEFLHKIWQATGSVPQGVNLLCAGVYEENRDAFAALDELFNFGSTTEQRVKEAFAHLRSDVLWHKEVIEELVLKALSEDKISSLRNTQINKELSGHNTEETK